MSAGHGRTPWLLESLARMHRRVAKAWRLDSGGVS